MDIPLSLTGWVALKKLYAAHEVTGNERW